MKVPEDDYQRIYIGGLNPSKLTVEMVLERIRQLSSSSPPIIELLQVDDLRSHLRPCYQDTRTYFFITARSIYTTKTPSDKNHHKETALEVLSKMFHNVKWKGCTLQLHLARPHFLERLALERQAAAAESMSNVQEHVSCISKPESESINRPQQGHDDSTKKLKLPRILRIRKRHAAEAFTVDTKPITIEPEASSFSNQMIINYQKMEQEWCNCIRKQKLKRQKYQEKIFSKKKLHTSRSLLATKDFSLQQEQQQSLLPSMSQATFLNRAIHLRFYNVGDEDEANTSKDKQSCTTKVQDYEENDNMSMNSSNDLSYSKSDVTEGGDVTEDISANASLHPSPFSSGSLHRPILKEKKETIIQEKRNIAALTTKKGKYVWSDDDDDDDTESASSVGKVNGNYTMNESFENTEARLLRLEDDVTSNMRILSSLFPTSILSTQEENDDYNQMQKQNQVGEHLNKIDSHNQSPSSSSNEEEMKFSEIHYGLDIQKQQQQSSDNVATNDTTHSSKLLNNSTTEKEESSSRSYIYEQEKLETIFSIGKSTTAAPLFNFFDDSEVAKSSQGNHTIETPKLSLPRKTEINLNNNSVLVSNAGERNSKSEIGLDLSNTRNIRGMCFPQDILDEYTRQFYSMNGGAELMNLDSSKSSTNENRDSTLVSEWEEERKVLTLDWKRKRKMALAQRRASKFTFLK